MQLAASGHDAAKAEPARAHHVNFECQVALGLNDVVHAEKGVKDREYLHKNARTG